jgi:hypothetical protein
VLPGLRRRRQRTQRAARQDSGEVQLGGGPPTRRVRWRNIRANGRTDPIAIRQRHLQSRETLGDSLRHPGPIDAAKIGDARPVDVAAGDRITSLGISAFRYKLTAFVISGAMCGVAGALLANHNLFVSPAIMHWSRSGEIMIMVVFGGIGTLLGPVLGATVYLALEDSMSRMTEHWQVFLGPLLILVVLFREQGIYGALMRRRRKQAHDGQP